MNKNMIISEMLDMVLEKYVKEIMKRDILENDIPSYAASDSMAEILEKMAILHIRTWHLEDAIQEAKSDEEVADLKRKIDICFKQKRPQLVAALNASLDDAIVRAKSVREESVKLYKGVQ
jgi:predicted small metal-binding protein